jgi:hypothetical protein
MEMILNFSLSYFFILTFSLSNILTFSLSHFLVRIDEVRMTK